jgi:TonB family protein
MQLTLAEAYARLGNTTECEYALHEARVNSDEQYYIRSIAEVRSGGKAHQLDVSEYMSNMQDRFRRHWSPPKLTDSTTTLASFNVQPNGEITDLAIARSSGDKEMDRACLQAVKSSSPVAFLPPGSTKPINVEFAFNYNRKARSR